MLRTADKLLQVGSPLHTAIKRTETFSMTSEGELTASSGGTLLTLNGVGNTKPATWTQIVASTAADADGFFVTLQTGDVGIADFLVDVGLGAASSEVTIVTNMLYTHGSSESAPARAYFPIPIPAGSRIAMRMQSTDTTAAGVRAIVTLVNGGLAAKLKCRVATTYGADTSDSGGQALDAGGSANTKPASFTTISASVTYGFESCVICVGQRNNAAQTAQNILLDIAVGAAASETVIVPDFYLRATAAEDIYPKMIWVPATVRAGQRLSGRIQSSTNDATDRIIDVVVIGFS